MKHLQRIVGTGGHNGEGNKPDTEKVPQVLSHIWMLKHMNF